MGRGFWFGFTGLLVAGVITGGYVLFTPKIGHATPAQINAVLPASLKAQDSPDPQGEARYRRLTGILEGIDREALSSKGGPSMGKSTPQNEALLGKVESLLGEGGLRVPPRAPDGLFKEAPSMKDAAKLIGLAINTAQERGDRAACARWSSLGLRYANALKGSGGMVIDALVDVAADSVILRAIYLAEINGGLDEAGRARLLPLLAPEDGRAPRMAEAVRRDFQTYWMPLLLNPQAHAKDLATTGEYNFDEPPPEPKLAGTFDPVDTARMSGRVYDAIIDDLRRPFAEARHSETKMIAEAERGLPRPAFEGPEGYWYRLQMNLGKNTLGRQGVASGALTQLGEATARNAVNRNLLRAVMLLRSGGTPHVPDPYGKGVLKWDAKRKIVWSVGKDGKDDRGNIGGGLEDSAADYGSPYGDRSWAPQTARPPAFGLAGPPPGMPPP